MVKLAIEGGEPVFKGRKLPVIDDVSGRDIGDEELKLVTEVIKSGRLNYLHGYKVAEFERDFAAKYGIKYAVASSSGTAAIHIAVNTIDVNPGDEIIVAPITDMGTVIPVLYQNVIPIFADVTSRTYTINPESIEMKLSEKTRAIIVVHLFGHPCDMDPIMEIARKHNLYVIEDCCQAFLTEYKRKTVGTIGDIGCFSFQQSKHMTTGDGGMTITNSNKFSKRLRLCSDKGWPRGGRYRDHLFLAPNYHMTELQAAVGIAQLRKLESVVGKRRKKAELLSSLIRETPGIKPPYVAEWAKHTYWKYAIEIDSDVLGVSTENFTRALSAEGIPSWAGYTKVPLYLYDVLRKKKTYGTSKCPFNCPFYGKEIKYKVGLCPVAEKVLKQMIVFPWSEKYTERDVHDIARGIKKVSEFYLNRSN